MSTFLLACTVQYQCSKVKYEFPSQTQGLIRRNGNSRVWLSGRVTFFVRLFVAFGGLLLRPSGQDVQGGTESGRVGEWESMEQPHS